MKQDPSQLIEFPCHYQFKAVGICGDQFHRDIVAAVEKFVQVSADNVKSRPSGNGNYQAVTVFVTLHSYDQLTAIYGAMKQISGLKMLL